MARRRIVVLDDDLTAVDLLGALFDQGGYPASVARPDVGSRPRLRGRPPALLLVDIIAPCHESRWRLPQQLRSDPTTRAIPILVTTTDTRWLAAYGGALAMLGLRALVTPCALDTLLAPLAALLAPGACGDRGTRTAGAGLLRRCRGAPAG